MKYFSRLNLEFDYDELEASEVLVLSAPDDFEFNDDKTEKFCKFKNWNFERKKSYTFFYYQITDIVPYGKKGKTRKVVWNLYGLTDFLEYKNPMRSEVIKWLEDNYGVHLLETKEI
jgi:hypothetical protein